MAMLYLLSKLSVFGDLTRPVYHQAKLKAAVKVTRIPQFQKLQN